MLGPRSNVVDQDQQVPVYTGLHLVQPAVYYVVLLLSLAKASMEVPMALSPSSTVPSPCISIWRMMKVPGLRARAIYILPVFSEFRLNYSAMHGD